ncbi:hypothetical protein DBP19_36465 [Streptomyces sp. CS090A]|uniref:hypothetical protein n=1 Tax=Streptomyces sp. CS090A TaxID=2162710 RepID=UPI000D517BC7|nr:hypothetical protein [Streptomyces sp. CS090A]PVC80635.1 hypothetical protein DBP19_36465 [Streptomyces sp. CS090A]
MTKLLHTAQHGPVNAILWTLPRLLTIPLMHATTQTAHDLGTTPVPAALAGLTAYCTAVLLLDHLIANLRTTTPRKDPS